MHKTLRLLFVLTLGAFVCQARAQNALDFDGTDDKVDCGNDTSVQIKGKAITLEAWIYPTAWKTNAYDGNVICKEYNTSNYGYMLRVGAGGKLNFALGDGTWHEITTGVLLSLNTWQHIAGTYDGNKMRVYLNGAAVDSLSYNGSISVSSSTPLILGAHSSYTRFYQGMIDEVRVWSICRSANEISNGRYNEICSKTSGLRAYYKFNQGKAGLNNSTVKTVTDYSGYKNTGTLTAFALTSTASNWLKGQSYYKAVTNANDTVVRCDRFFSPSGKYKWFSSGVYHDTIPTTMGCDSAITYYLTIKKSTSKSIKVYACTNYVSPSGVYNWTQSGVYTDYLVNAAKCDSVITIDLRIGGSRDTIYPEVCKNYVVPSGKKTLNQTGVYSDTLKNFRGCDSVIAIYLTILPPTTSTLNVKTCRGYTSPSGKYIWKKAGTYYDTIVNHRGCDSFITVNVSLTTSAATITRVSCNSYASPSGKYTWTKSGSYFDTIPNYLNCDSVIKINLTIKNTTFSTISRTACRYALSPDGKAIWRKSGVYKDTLVNKQGCDSIITVNLTIIKLNNGITQASTVLTSLSNSGTYQWLNCTLLKMPVSGATGKVFTATVNADYAVEVTDSGCRDTSACVSVVSAGLKNNPNIQSLKIYPNPNAGEFVVDLPAMVQNGLLVISEITGKKVYELAVKNQSKITVNALLPKGIYLVKILNSEANFAEYLVVE